MSEWIRKDDVLKLIYDLSDVTTADVVEVVRCKGCKHYSADGWGYGNCYRPHVDYLRMADCGFCSYGERREDGEIH